MKKLFVGTVVAFALGTLAISLSPARAAASPQDEEGLSAIKIENARLREENAILRERVQLRKENEALRASLQNQEQPRPAKQTSLTKQPSPKMQPARAAESAYAAYMPTKAPMMAPMAAPMYNWTGVYIGINGGGAFGRESWNDNTTVFPLASITHNPNGGVFGGQLGFRYQWSQLVLGVEGTWDWAGLRDSVTSGGDIETFKVKSLYTVTGQVGLAWDRWLPYVKGGWAGAQTSFDIAAFGLDPSNSQTANGWTIGGGIDYAVWQNLILGVEYDHFNLNYGQFTVPGLTLEVSNLSRLTIDQVVARLSYKFDLR